MILLIAYHLDTLARLMLSGAPLLAMGSDGQVDGTALSRKR